MHDNYCTIMFYIMQKAGPYGKLEISTVKLAKETGSTQQTTSRKLIEMEKKGYIARQHTADGFVIHLDNAGIEHLRRCYHVLKNAFDTKVLQIKGNAVSGLGEGRYYVSLPGYQRQFKQKLGFSPYPGTLNIFVKDLNVLTHFLSSLHEITISGFETHERTYGAIKAYMVHIKNNPAAIIMPERARHPKGIVEIISPINIKQKLRIKEKSEVIVKC